VSTLLEAEGTTTPPALPGFAPAETKALRITTTFETGKPLGFGGLSGDFDGQGLSFGMLQWNFGSGSLLPLLRDFDGGHPDRFDTVFAAGAARLRQLLHSDALRRCSASRKLSAARRRAVIKQCEDEKRETRMQFARAINLTNPRTRKRDRIAPAWAGYFAKLERDPVFQRIQLRYARGRMNKAIEHARRLGLRSERGLALMFDLVTQQGGAWHQVRGRDAQIRDRIAAAERSRGGSLTERERLSVIADVIADTSSERWREKVRARKHTIVNGRGTVHGQQWDLERQYGLTDRPWQAGTPAAGELGSDAGEIAWDSQEFEGEGEEEWEYGRGRRLPPYRPPFAARPVPPRGVPRFARPLGRRPGSARSFAQRRGYARPLRQRPGFARPFGQRPGFARPGFGHPFRQPPAFGRPFIRPGFGQTYGRSGFRQAYARPVFGRTFGQGPFARPYAYRPSHAAIARTRLLAGSRRWLDPRALGSAFALAARGGRHRRFRQPGFDGHIAWVNGVPVLYRRGGVGGRLVHVQPAPDSVADAAPPDDQGFDVGAEPAPAFGEPPEDVGEPPPTGDEPDAATAGAPPDGAPTSGGDEGTSAEFDWEASAPSQPAGTGGTAVPGGRACPRPATRARRRGPDCPPADCRCTGPGEAPTCPAVSDMICVRAVDGVPLEYLSARPVRDPATKLYVVQSRQARDHRFTPAVYAALRQFIANMRTFRMPIEGIITLGTYNCRCITGTNRLSNHSFGDAIDIVGVRWAPGATVGSRLRETIIHNLCDPTERALLARINACLRLSFATVIDYHRSDHRNHFHVDTNQGRGSNPRGSTTIIFVQEALANVLGRSLPRDGKIGGATTRRALGDYATANQALGQGAPLDRVLLALFHDVAARVRPWTTGIGDGCARSGGAREAEAWEWAVV
jgi:hypothetical protein